MIEHDGKFYRNQSWNATHLGYDYHLYATDFPPENAPEINRLFPVIMRNTSLVAGPTASKADGKPAEDWKLQGFGNVPMIARTVKVGFRTYTIVANRHFTHRDDDAELTKRFERFASSVKISFDPTAKDFDPLQDANWDTLPKTNGFSVVGPKGVREEIAQIGLGFKDAILKGVRYSSEDDVIQLQISIFPVTPTWDYKRITTEMIGRDKITDGPKDVKLDTANAEDRTFEDFFKNPITLRTAQVGNSVVGIRIVRKNRQPDKDYLDRQARVLNTFKLGNGGGTTTPGGPTIGQKGDLEFAANIAPFWAGASLPSQKVFLALGTREGAGKNRAGTLLRYSYPDFKLQATYHLPQPVTHVVVDEKANKFYCAAVTKDNPALNLREKAFLPSVVHVYDLKPILDGSLKELAEIKPLTVFGINGNISGMELAPDGSMLYVGVQTPPSSPRGNYTGRIHRYDCDKLKANGELGFADAINAMRLSPDGKRLIAGEIPLNGAGGINIQGKQLSLSVIDTEAWKKAKTIPLQGVVADLTFRDDHLFALVAEQIGFKTYHVTDDGIAKNISPNIVGKSFLYLRTTANGNYAIASAGGTADGVWLFEIIYANNAFTLKQVGFGESQAEKKLGGQFVLTQDNKFAVMQSGSVIDLLKSTAAK